MTNRISSLTVEGWHQAQQLMHGSLAHFLELFRLHVPLCLVRCKPHPQSLAPSPCPLPQALVFALALAHHGNACPAM